MGTTDICNSAFFATGSLAVLRAVDTLHTRDVGTQSSQLVALGAQLSSFPARLLLSTVIPVVCRLCVSNPALWVYALPLHVHLASTGRMPLQDYRIAASKALSLGLRVTQPIETMQVFLRHMSFVQDTFDAAFFAEFAVNGLFANALNNNQHVTLQLQTLAVLCDDRARSAICEDRASLLDVVVPKVCREACKNAEGAVKVLALYFLSLAVASGRLDKTYLAKNLLPSLKYITEHDKSPSVSMCVAGVYEAMSDSLGPEYIATAILPTLAPMLVERSLDKAQFSLLAQLVLRLTKRTLDMRTRELALPDIVMTGIDHTPCDPFAAAKELLARTRAQSQAASNTPYQNLTLPVDFTSAMGAAAQINLPPPPSTPAPALPPPSPRSAPPPPPSGNILALPASSAPATLAGAWGASSSSSSSSPSSSSSSYSYSSSSSSSVGYQPPAVGATSGFDDFLSSFSKPAGFSAAQPAMSASAPSRSAPAESTGGTLSLEEQIKQTQAQIALLAGGMGPNPNPNLALLAGGMGGQMPMHPAVGAGAYGGMGRLGLEGAYGGMGGMAGMNSGGLCAQQQQPQQQPQQQYFMGGGMMPLQGQQQYVQQHMGNVSLLPSTGGYQPPTFSVPPPSGTAMQPPQGNKADPFDFLS